jgi:hypothetical protein
LGLDPFDLVAKLRYYEIPRWTPAKAGQCFLLLTTLIAQSSLAQTDPANARKSLPQSVSVPAATNLNLGQFVLSDPVLGMNAWTFVAPADWKRSGGVYWTGQLIPIAYYSKLTVVNPTNRDQFELFPTLIFVATDNPLWAGGRPTSPFLQADESVTRILLPRFRPQARNVKVLSVDKQAAQLITEARVRARTQGVLGCEIRAARVCVEYEEANATFREMFFCTLAAPPPTGAGPLVWCVERAFGLRVEKARFESSYRLLGLIASSLRENQDWVLARGRRLRAMIPPPTPTQGSGSPSILDVSRSISRNNDQFLKNIDAIHTQRLNSPASDGWTRAFRNTDLRQNPTTGEQIEVSGGYLQYYQDYSGRIYGSNDPTDFYQQLKIGGTVLERTR